MTDLKLPSTCEGKNLARAIVDRRDSEVESGPLFLSAMDWRGVYARRYTYSFDSGEGRWCRYRRYMFSRPAGLAWNCLYDREADRWELQNLYDSPDHKKLRTQLHEQTLSWIKRFGDKGVPCEQMEKTLFSSEDFELARDPERMRMISGMLKGRPIDLV